MKYAGLFLTFVLFLSSCAAPATPVPTQTATAVPTATQTPTQTPSPTPTIVPTPTQIGGGSGKLIFELDKAQFAKNFPTLQGDNNVFMANTDGSNLVPVTNGLWGNNFLESISPDGTKALVSSALDPDFKDQKHTSLYSVDLNSLGSEPVKLASGLSQGLWRAPIAKWVDNSRAVYIGSGESGFGIYAINSDGTNPTNIYNYSIGGAGKPVGIMAVNQSSVYWYGLVAYSLGAGMGGNMYSVKQLPWWSNLDGSGQEGPLESNGKQLTFDNPFSPLVFSPDGTKVVWVKSANPGYFPYHNYMDIATYSNLDNPYTLHEAPAGLAAQLTWWPDGTKILVFDPDSLGSGLDPTNDLLGLYTVSIPSLSITNEHRTDVLDTLTKNICGGQLGDFSPDGRQILIDLPEHRTINHGECISKESILNLETMTLTDALPGLYPNNVKWLP